MLRTALAANLESGAWHLSIKHEYTENPLAESFAATHSGDDCQAQTSSAALLFLSFPAEENPIRLTGLSQQKLVATFETFFVLTLAVISCRHSNMEIQMHNQ